jgi:hypothetical protein
MRAFGRWAGVVLGFGGLLSPCAIAQDAAKDSDVLLAEADSGDSGAAQRRWMEALLDSLASTGTPRQQVLAGEYRSKSDVTRQSAIAEVIAAARRVPEDRVAQWSASNLASTAVPCDAACTHAAGGLARIEPDNAAAWLPVLARATRDGDVRRADQAIAAMASATRADDAFVATAEAWANVFELVDVPGPEDYPKETRPMIAGIAIAAAGGVRGYQDLMEACNIDRLPTMPDARREECAGIGRTMLEQGRTAQVRMFGMGVLRRSGTASPADQAMHRREQWQKGAVWRTFGTRIDPAEEGRYLRDLAATGDEIDARSRQMLRLGIPMEPPAGWSTGH